MNFNNKELAKDKILVSICCLAYNHENYIRQCLEGFLMQKTNFEFEILIHDDASLDHTTNIIREYEQKYPEIMDPPLLELYLCRRQSECEKKYDFCVYFRPPP